ncbi:putative endo-xylogalacturonan hydrolase A [Aspergillus coremiiformis]|uniref:Putative endo-xylogalacturonan hydrolase A n=1 Tax=Aspergillus coremiiformis TaxID=138285 RepID=A0A5N6ZEW5_9EURO|nr:putative endo-xylogalacturonan hydrolase A [Aspergillus coremiiformis]
MTGLNRIVLLSVFALSSVVSGRVAIIPDATIRPRAVCTPTAGGSASTDDVPAIQQAIASCGNGGTIVIPAGSTYYLNSVLDLKGCSNCDFQVEGLLQFTGSTEYWAGKTAMIRASGITGLKLHSQTGSGVIDGKGQASWDLFAKDTTYKRPTLLYITGGSGIVVSSLRLKDPPNVFVSVNGGTSNAQFTDLAMDAVSTSVYPVKNTDAFDIGASTYVTISSVKVINGDDCVAFKPGANYVTVENVSCTGSHGISVGSLGKSGADTVQNIYANNIVMIRSTKAAGIKTYPTGGSHGLSTVKNVTFSNFKVDNCDYGFQIESCYGEKGNYCTQNPGNAVLQGIVVNGFTGTTSGKYDPVVANLNCGSQGTCDVSISNFIVKAPSGGAKVLCSNTPSTLGLTCTAGASG